MVSCKPHGTKRGLRSPIKLKSQQTDKPIKNTINKSDFIQ